MELCICWYCKDLSIIYTAQNEQYENYDHELKTEHVKDYPLMWSINYSQ